MQIGQMARMASTGVTALAFKALNSSDTLNSLVNRMTGGSINRDTLAQKVLRDAVGLGLEYAADKKLLGDRSASLAPLAGKIFFDNTSDEMHASIKGLANEFLASETSQDPGMLGALKSLGTETMKAGAGGLAHLVANTVTETQFLEKLIATMINGGENWKPLDSYLEKKLEGKPMKGFISNLVKDVIQRAIVDKKELNQNDSNEYRLLAGSANAYLTDNDYKQPLNNYFTGSAKAALPDAVDAMVQGVGQAVSDLTDTAVKTAEILVDGYADIKDHLAGGEFIQGGIKTATTVTNAAAMVAVGVATGAVPTLVKTAATLTGITVRAAVGTVILATPSVIAGATSLYQGALSEADRMYHAAAGQSAYKNGGDAYEKDIEQATQTGSLQALPMPDARTSDSQWTNALASQQSVVQFALPTTVLTTAQRSVSLEQAFEKGQIDGARKNALADLTDKLSPEQIAPFGLFSATHQVAHNVVSGHLARMASESQADLPVASTTSQAMARVIDATPLKESSKAGYKVADTYAQHVGKLALDFPEGVYSYTDASKDNLNATGNLWWGENVTLADRAELRKLYNTCGGNEQLTLQVGRFLDPDMASQALAAPVLRELDPKNTGLLQLPTGLQLKLADTTAQYQYQLRPKGENVELTISATWDVKEYGTDAQQLRSPQGTQPSQLTSSITLTIAPDGTLAQSAPSLQCSIRNEFKFDTYGAWEKSAAADA